MDGKDKGERGVRNVASENRIPILVDLNLHNTRGSTFELEKKRADDGAGERERETESDGGEN